MDDKLSESEAFGVWNIFHVLQDDIEASLQPTNQDHHGDLQDFIRKKLVPKIRKGELIPLPDHETSKHVVDYFVFGSDTIKEVNKIIHDHLRPAITAMKFLYRFEY